jgi:anti-sigma-K factor RskA
MDSTDAQGESWESKLIDYTLGLMEPSEAEVFAASLAECRRHAQLANHYEQTMSWIGVVAQSAELPSGHKGRLMSRIGATPQVQVGASSLQAQATMHISDVVPSDTAAPAPLAPVQPPAKTIAATSGAKPTVVDLAKYRERRRNTFIGALGAIAAALILVVGLSSLFGQGNKLVIPAGYRAVQLAPQAGFDTVSAVVLYDPTKNEATLLATGFPQVPAGKVYELWLVPTTGTGAPVQEGTFVPNSSGESQHDAKAPQNIDTYAGVAVTLEDAPGGDTPKGEFVVVGPLPTHE